MTSRFLVKRLDGDMFSDRDTAFLAGLLKQLDAKGAMVAAYPSSEAVYILPKGAEDRFMATLQKQGYIIHKK